MDLDKVISNFGLFDPNWKEKVKEMDDWCQENCSGFYHYDMLVVNIRWIFVLEEDAMAFKLRWE